MEHIKEALIKARASLDRQPFPEHREIPAALAVERLMLGPKVSVSPPWDIQHAALSAERLERQRIVSFGTSDPSHVAFNLLRTRVRKALQDNHWHKIAVTSPTPGCGKTMVALNLAFSLARLPDCRTVLVDLDLKKPAVAQTLGISAPSSIGEYLKGKASAEDCFLQVSENLIVGANRHPMRDSSELIQSPKVAHLISSLSSALSPDVVLFDLPPIGAGDDVLAFLPNVEAALLVAASGKSTATEVEESERQISGIDKLLGVVLNKCEDTAGEYHY